ncbi:hypothetical protein AC578_1468 [Pseudocercospora eumusae]|uniref:Uncharacterized protein n=1 Tax=Pseudocercospora eumusae TaxID=321146 RepID=A0A139H6J2_9PEZI|nr:hypothetical protein AC578_1468 [Pseudocercospora eumusae]
MCVTLPATYPPMPVDLVNTPAPQQQQKHLGQAVLVPQDGSPKGVVLRHSAQLPISMKETPAPKAANTSVGSSQGGHTVALDQAQDWFPETETQPLGKTPSLDQSAVQSMNFQTQKQSDLRLNHV